MNAGHKPWNLMASHGVVLFYLAANPDATMRQMSESLGITERQVARIVKDLDEAGMIEVDRIGRRNTYRVNGEARFRHPTLSHVRLGEFMQVLSGNRG
jgi:DNA-binding MarR family transcriptional regulator